MTFPVLDLLRIALAVAGWPAATVGFGEWIAAQAPYQAALAAAPVASIDAGTANVRQPGEFLRDNFPVANPSAAVRFERGFEIMTYQVSAADYARCIADGACQPSDVKSRSQAGAPATGVSFNDAEAYAEWYSRETGQVWRLPTDAEWAYAAAERFAGDVVVAGKDPANPAAAWISRYREEAERSGGIGARPQAGGHFGANSRGVFDLAGNVWEWTSTCYARSTLRADGSVLRRIDNCGVHVVEGRHRTYMSNFIRDGKSGGCAGGTPPDNLGFRLVRDAVDANRPIS